LSVEAGQGRREDLEPLKASIATSTEKIHRYPRPRVRSPRPENAERHDRAMQHGNISHLVANEVEAFAGERGGSLAVPRKPSFWRSQAGC